MRVVYVSKFIIKYFEEVASCGSVVDDEMWGFTPNHCPECISSRVPGEVSPIGMAPRIVMARCNVGVKLMCPFEVQNSFVAGKCEVGNGGDELGLCVAMWHNIGVGSIKVINV
jgi:hypothetical protein